MTTTVQHAGSTLSTFSVALEQGDSVTLLSLYAEQAEVCLANSSTPDRSPRIVRGKPAIAHWVNAFCGRNYDVLVVDAVQRETELTIIAECRHQDGTRFVLACNAQLRAGLVINQFVVVV